MDQVRVFSNDGIWIDQIRTQAERAWTLVTETSAAFSLSVHNSKCNPDTIQFGNLVLIENSDDLLPWVGVIDDISFDRGKCFVWAYTPERYFVYRRGPRRLTLTGNAGSIFSQMVTYINNLDPTVLTIGDIDSQTNGMQETLNPTLLIDNLKRIVERSGEGYRWRPEVIDGKLVVHCDWFPSLIQDNGLILHDGYNISGDHPLSFASPVNDFLTYGFGADWEKRIVAIATDDASRQKYGLRQASTSINTKSVDTLNIAAQVFLNAEKEPAPSFPISALNVGDTFSKLVPGALATFTKLVGQGFTDNELGFLSYSQIVQSMVYSPAQGDVALSL